MNNNALFYATDADIYDALYSSKQRVTSGLLVELLRARGILVSDEAPRDDMVDYLSSLPHDYNDFTHLLDSVSSSARSEKTASTSLSEKIDKKEIDVAFDSVKSSRDDRNETYSMAVVDDKVIIDVQYTEIDRSKTRLRQRTHKEAKIEIELVDGKTKIRHPANDRMHDIVDTIISKIEQNKPAPIAKESIDFSGIPSHEIRSDFFKQLISNIDGYKLQGVTKINVNHLESSDNSEADNDQKSEEDYSAAEQELVGIVENAILKGESLLSSKEFQSLAQNGFYITSIRWTTEKQTTPRNVLEFEAQFYNAKNCTQFRYNVLGEYTKLDQGYTKTRKPLKAHEKTQYLRLIESTAQNVYSSILEEQTDAQPNI